MVDRVGESFSTTWLFISLIGSEEWESLSPTVKKVMSSFLSTRMIFLTK